MFVDVQSIRREITRTDLTRRELITAIVTLAVPSILQGILVHCYAFNDFVFVGQMRDKDASAAGTAALSATVGLQIILSSIHNAIPSGCNAYVAQYKGAKNTNMVMASFRAGFFACIFISTIVAILGKTFIHEIASVSNSSPEITESIEAYLGTLLVTAPAFGLLLLVDGFYKANGDTVTPLKLELFSLALNTFLNYLFVIQFDWGITGAAAATALSRLFPGLVGMYLLHRENNTIGITVSLFDFAFEKSITNSGGPIANGADSVAYEAVPNLDDSSRHGDASIEMTKMELAENPLHNVSQNDNDKVIDDNNDHVIENYSEIDNDNSLKEENTISSDNSDLDDSVMDVNKLLKELDEHGIKSMDSNEINDGDMRTNWAAISWFMLISSVKMFKIGCFDSISGQVYGITFTWMIRLAGWMGSGPQAGLGAAMRGLEWMAYCLGEGFLVSALTCVGQCIGAKMYFRAMESAWICVGFSAFIVGTAGLPFLLFPDKLATLLTRDSDIQHYCAEYVRIVGYSMAAVGFEGASYGALIGAGKARTMAFVNGFVYLIRVPLALVLCSTPLRMIPSIFLYVATGLGDKSAIEERSLVWHNDPTFAFGGICYVICLTAMFKAGIYFCMFSYRTVTGIYFSDCSLVTDSEPH